MERFVFICNLREWRLPRGFRVCAAAPRMWHQFVTGRTAQGVVGIRFRDKIGEPLADRWKVKGAVNELS